MLPWYLPPSFPSIWLTIQEQIINDDLQDSRRRCCSKIFKKADNFSNSESLCRSDASNQVLTQSDLWFGRRCPLKNFKMAAMGMSFEVFHDGPHGGHLGYGNRTILAIMNLYNSPKPHIKFQLNLTYCLGLDVVWRIPRWPPSWILEWNNFSNSEFLCHCDASHPVLAQTNLRFGSRCRLRISRRPPWWPSWISEWNKLSNSESLFGSHASHKVLAQSDMVLEEISFEEFQDGHYGSHLGYRNGTILAILNLCVTLMPPIKFQLNRT